MTSIALADQFAVAVQHSPRGPGNHGLNSSFHISCFKFSTAHQRMRLCFCFCQTFWSGLPHWSLHNQDDGLHCQYDDSAVYTAIFTRDVELSVRISLLHLVCWGSHLSKTKVAQPVDAPVFVYVIIETILPPQNEVNARRPLGPKET